MSNVLDFLPLIIKQTFASQTLERTPEPEQLLNDSQQVADYTELAALPLILTYAIALLHIGKAWRSVNQPARILDLASGPGHFSLILSKIFPDSKVTGVDLADNMVALASSSANKINYQDRCNFEVGDVTNLKNFTDASVELTTSTNSAHHMPNLEILSRMLVEMERVTTSTGLVFIYDSARLKNKSITIDFVKMGGKAALDRGFKIFYEDFYNSMFASWTPNELASVIPKNTQRRWIQLVPFGLPSSQIILGLPQGDDTIFFRKDDVYNVGQLIPQLYQQEWGALNLVYKLAKKLEIK